MRCLSLGCVVVLFSGGCAAIPDLYFVPDDGGASIASEPGLDGSSIVEGSGGGFAPAAAPDAGWPVDAGSSVQANDSEDAGPGRISTDAGSSEPPPYACGSGATCYCSGSSCIESCAGGAGCGPMACGDHSCLMICSGLAQCPDIDCAGATSCAVQCSAGSTCSIECQNAASCNEVRCTGGSSCLLRCADPTNCRFVECSGAKGAVSCPDGVLACNRACP
jgi:hypothetical protein